MINFILEHSFRFLIIVICFAFLFPWMIQIYHRNKAKGFLQGLHEFFNQLTIEEEEKENGKEKK